MVLNLAKIDRSVQIFWVFSQNCRTQANFDLSSWNFGRMCTNIEWYLILNFVRIGQDLQIFDVFEFFYFFYRDIKFWKFDVSTITLLLWGSQIQATYFLKGRTLWDRWGRKMGIPIHMLFDISNMVDFFHIFVITWSTKILIISNFWMEVYT